MYLRGRALLYRRGKSVPLALEQFQKAVALDPGYALAWAGIADVYTIFGYFGTGRPDEARPRALLLYQGDPAGSEREFLKALELNPHYLQGRCWFALFFLVWTHGRFEEGLTEARRALDGDPLSSYALAILALVLGTMGRGDEAIAAGRQSIEADPESFIARWALGQALACTGKAEEAVTVHREACRMAPQSTFAVASLATALARSGHLQEARSVYEQVCGRAASEYVASSVLAIVAVAAGERERALAFAKRAWDDREPYLFLVARHHQDYQ